LPSTFSASSASVLVIGGHDGNNRKDMLEYRFTGSEVMICQLGLFHTLLESFEDKKNNVGTDNRDEWLPE